jgi:hypothetical protein
MNNRSSAANRLNDFIFNSFTNLMKNNREIKIKKAGMPNSKT